MILSAKNYRQLLQRPGRYRDSIGEIRGLMLVVKNARNASWQLRYERNGKERWMGLGSARLIGLNEARTRTCAARLQLLDGNDPLLAKQQAKAAAAAAALKSITFAQAATAYHGQHADKWKNPRDAAQFLDSLKEYAFPVLGALPVNAIDTALMLRVLERTIPARRGAPGGRFWDVRPTTASRVRRRIENVLDWCSVRGYRSGDNPARWAGHLRGALPHNAKAAAKHMPALPYAAAAAFIADLQSREGVTARALEFTILTAARTGETLGATWDEIDLAAGVWTIPAARMKGGKEHRVPLADAAIALLRALPNEDGNRCVFIGGRAGAPLAADAMIKSLGDSGITVHGFRSTFRDWAAECTNYPNHVVEMALAHTIGDRVEASYRRGDLFEKRRKLMADWSRYCNSPPSVANVLPLRSA